MAIVPLYPEAYKVVDFALHEADIESVPNSLKDPKNTYENNITGTLNIFPAAGNANIKRIVCTTSSSTMKLIRGCRS